jgi:hypothetical protein
MYSSWMFWFITLPRKQLCRYEKIICFSSRLCGLKLHNLVGVWLNLLFYFFVVDVVFKCMTIAHKICKVNEICTACQWSVCSTENSDSIWNMGIRSKTRFPQYHNPKYGNPTERRTPHRREIFILNYNDHPAKKTLKFMTYCIMSGYEINSRRNRTDLC